MTTNSLRILMTYTVLYLIRFSLQIECVGTSSWMNIKVNLERLCNNINILCQYPSKKQVQFLLFSCLLNPKRQQ